MESLKTFGEKVNGDRRLKDMNKDWDRCIHVKPTEGDGATLLYEDGEMTSAHGLSGEPDIVLEAPTDVLLAIFTGDASPTEPYLDGTLRVTGSQEDMLRLDFLSLMIWGED